MFWSDDQNEGETGGIMAIPAHLLIILHCIIYPNVGYVTSALLLLKVAELEGPWKCHTLKCSLYLSSTHISEMLHIYVYCCLR